MTENVNPDLTQLSTCYNLKPIFCHFLILIFALNCIRMPLGDDNVQKKKTEQKIYYRLKYSKLLLYELFHKETIFFSCFQLPTDAQRLISNACFHVNLQNTIKSLQ